MAYAILRGRGMSDNEAMKTVMEINEFAHPNKRIVRLTKELFGEK